MGVIASAFPHSERKIIAQCVCCLPGLAIVAGQLSLEGQEIISSESAIS